MTRHQITSHETGETVELSRDVRHAHPEWVHEQMGTETEAELQGVLDHYSDEEMVGQGPDVSGVELVEDLDADVTEIVEAIRGAGPDAVVAITDAGSSQDVLVWESEDLSRDDDGRRAVGRWAVSRTVVDAIRAAGVREV